MDVSFGEEADDDEYDDAQRSAREQEGLAEKECIIFLLDARASMLVSSQPGVPSPLEQALASIADCIRDRIISADGDLFGVILFGTEHSKVPAGMQAFPNTYVLLEPGAPSAAAIRQLQLLLRLKNYSEFGHMLLSAEFELNNVLWLVAMLLSSSPQTRKCRRRVLLVTSDDAPCPGAESRRRALLRTRDLFDASVHLEPMFLSPPPPRSFDLSPGSFWHELLFEVCAKHSSADLEADGEACIERVDEWVSSCLCEDEASLFARIRRTQHRKRSYGTVDLRISDESRLSLKMVSYIRTFVKPPTKKHHAASNEPLSSERTHICNQHGSVLQPSDMWKGWDFGGKWVYFEPYELRQICDGLGKTGLTLLGFKSVDRLKLYHNLRTPVFLEPADVRPGSTCAAQALVQAMSDKKKVAICSFRRNSALKLVALLPQLHELDKETRTVHLPTGFHMVQLPWADEVRSPELPPPLALKDFSDQQLDATRSLVRQLQLPEGATFSKVSNPAAHRYFAIMQAVVLGTEQVEETVDTSRPDAAWLTEHSHCVENFLDAFQIPAPSEPTARGGEDRAAKRTKMSAPETQAEWLSLFARVGNEGLSGLTNGVLKDFCKKNSLSQAGKKDDLVARVAAKLAECVREEEPTLVLADGRQDE